MRLIIDGNSYLNQALLRGEDKEFGRVVKDADGKEHQVNSANYGMEGFWDKYLAALKHFDVPPRQTLIIWDGMNAKQRRRSFLPTYKQGRDKIPEVNEQLNLARDTIKHATYFLGATSIEQNGMEADDVIGFLCKRLRHTPNVVCTADGDLSVLVDDNTSVWRLGQLNENPCGPFPHKYITLYKALVGDTSDKIPGAVGFGDAAFIDFVRTFELDGLDELQAMILEGRLDELKDSVADFPRVKKILEQKDLVTTCWRVASLMLDEVDTLRKPLEIAPGMNTCWADVPEDLRVHDLKRFYGTKTLVTAANYEDVKNRFAAAVLNSPFVPLDIETSATPESEEWSERLKSMTEADKLKLDVLGHELSGMSITFGENLQHTIYMSVDHADTDNITVDQCREMCELIPQRLQIIVQNRSFEFSVLYRTWGDKWMDNGWHGFLPNCIDSAIGAQYQNENIPRGLKERSRRHLGYEQQTYEEVTTLSGPAGGFLPPGGQIKRTYLKEVEPALWVTQVDDMGLDQQVLLHEAKSVEWEDAQYRMNQLTAKHVLNYGCDDTICTGALQSFYQLVMEIEGTWDVYNKVETLPEYLTSLAFVQGIPVSLSKLREMEEKDEKRYDEAWATLRTFLMRHGWEGTTCPEFEGELEPSDVKLAAGILLGEGYSTKKRKLNAMAFDMRAQFPDSQMAEALAVIVERGDTEALNHLLRKNFTGEPVINFGSPKQLQNLFYRVIGTRPRIFNKMTDKQRESNEAMADGFKKLRAARKLKVDLFTLEEPIAGKVDGKSYKCSPLTDEERDALISKASTDDSAVDWAVAKDPQTPEQMAVLKAFKVIKTVMTRRGLYYRTYKAIPHWRDGRIHPQLAQSAAVTLRYTSSAPNVQQLPKLGEGVEFRQVLIPHCKDAVVVSLDYAAQELRHLAEWSGDTNLTACYVGDNPKDVHALTAASAAIHLWGEEVTYEEFVPMLSSKDPAIKKKAGDLRRDAKPVNFGTNYDLQAPGLAEQLLVDEEIAQAFIDAKDAAMPGIEIWKAGVRKQVEEDGYATTFLGARRHLREQLMSEDRWEAARAGRQGPNFKIQSSSAEQTKLAQASMWKEGIFAGRFNARYYMPVHDEVVFSVHKEDAYEVIKAVHACMVQPYAGMKIPIVSSISLGPNFGEQIELGEWPDEEKINAALIEALGA